MSLFEDFKGAFFDTKKYLNIYEILGSALAAFSIIKIISLASSGFLSLAFKLLMTYYENLLKTILGFFDPAIFKIAHIMTSLTGINFHVLPHWRDVFVIMTILFSANIKSLGEYFGRGNVVVVSFCGLLISVLGSIIIGSVPIGAPLSSWGFFPKLFLEILLELQKYQIKFANFVGLDARFLPPDPNLIPTDCLILISLIFVFACIIYLNVVLCSIDFKLKINTGFVVSCALSALLLPFIALACLSYAYWGIGLVFNFFGWGEAGISKSGMPLMLITLFVVSISQLIWGYRPSERVYTDSPAGRRLSAAAKKYKDYEIDIMDISHLAGKHSLGIIVGVVIFLIANAGLSLLGL